MRGHTPVQLHAFYQLFFSTRQSCAVQDRVWNKSPKCVLYFTVCVIFHMLSCIQDIINWRIISNITVGGLSTVPIGPGESWYQWWRSYSEKIQCSAWIDHLIFFLVVSGPFWMVLNISVLKKLNISLKWP